MPQIIFIDDSQDNYSLFKEAFREIADQSSIICAKSGNEFFELLDKVTPRFIFIAAHIAEEIGISSIKSIWTQKKFQSVPVIVYSHPEELMEQCDLQIAQYYTAKAGANPGFLSAIRRMVVFKDPFFKRAHNENFMID